MKIDLTDKYDFTNIFVDGAIKILSDGMVQKRTQDLLTKGIQTAGNVFSQIGAATDKIQNIILSEVETYRKHFCESNEGFIKNWPSKYKIYGWLVSMKSGGNIEPHIHETGWVSGSIYINVPPDLKSDEGNLVVCLNDEILDDSIIERKSNSINVSTGSLCLFPSSLLHYTIPFESTEERIVLAFDMIPKNN